jgi:hypothetical protein
MKPKQRIPVEDDWKYVAAGLIFIALVAIFAILYTISQDTPVITGGEY